MTLKTLKITKMKKNWLKIITLKITKMKKNQLKMKTPMPMNLMMINQNILKF